MARFVRRRVATKPVSVVTSHNRLRITSRLCCLRPSCRVDSTAEVQYQIRQRRVYIYYALLIFFCHSARHSRRRRRRTVLRSRLSPPCMMQNARLRSLADPVFTRRRDLSSLQIIGVQSRQSWRNRCTSTVRSRRGCQSLNQFCGTSHNLLS